MSSVNRESTKKKIIVFGCGSDLRNSFDQLNEGYDIVCLSDNDPALHGTTLLGKQIIPPTELTSCEFDFVQICSLVATTRIREQIVALGIEAKKILPTPLWNQENLGKWRVLRESRKKKHVFIIGNGPSLTIDDLNLLHETRQQSFAFNKIYLAFDETPYRPDYYMVEDILVAKNNKNKINSLHGFPKFYPEFLLRNLDSADSDLIYGLNFPDENDLEAKMPTNDPTNFGWGGAVTCTAIQAAMHLGYSKIYLIGVDFDFKLQMKPKRNERVLVGNGEVNHFHKDYRLPGEKWNTPHMEITQNHYKMIEQLAKELNVKVFNATRGGKLETFERIRLEAVLS